MTSIVSSLLLLDLLQCPHTTSTRWALAELHCGEAHLCLSVNPREWRTVLGRYQKLPPAYSTKQQHLQCVSNQWNCKMFEFAPGMRGVCDPQINAVDTQ